MREQLDKVSLTFSSYNPFPFEPSAAKDARLKFQCYNIAIFNTNGLLFVGFLRHNDKFYKFWLFKNLVKSVTWGQGHIPPLTWSWTWSQSVSAITSPLSPSNCLKKKTREKIKKNCELTMFCMQTSRLVYWGCKIPKIYPPPPPSHHHSKFMGYILFFCYLIVCRLAAMVWSISKRRSSTLWFLASIDWTRRSVMLWNCKVDF